MDNFEVIKIVVLAVVQGITEFLPVSSSGHLVIVNEVLAGMHEWLVGSEAAAGAGEISDISDVNIVLHAGTLGSILVFYWTRIKSLLAEDKRVIPLLIAGTIPALAVGGVIKLCFDDVLESPMIAGAMLVVTGCVLLYVSKRSVGKKEYQGSTIKTAIAIGCAQAMAILPGLSRSGSTIAAGLVSGMNRSAAATFSFLLAIPILMAGSAYEILKMWKASQEVTPAAHTATWLLVTGAAVSFAVGLVSLWWLIKWVEKGKLHYFAYWCIPLGIAVMLWQGISQKENEITEKKINMQPQAVVQIQG